MALYEDEYVRLDAASVTLKMYYFPFGGDNTISRDSIQNIRTLVNPSFFETKTWGMAFSTVWWAFGWKEDVQHPKALIVIDTRDDSIGKGFVCCNGDVFMAAYRRGLPAP